MTTADFSLTLGAATKQYEAELLAVVQRTDLAARQSQTLAARWAQQTERETSKLLNKLVNVRHLFLAGAAAVAVATAATIKYAETNELAAQSLDKLQSLGDGLGTVVGRFGAAFAASVAPITESGGGLSRWLEVAIKIAASNPTVNVIYDHMKAMDAATEATRRAAAATAELRHQQRLHIDIIAPELAGLMRIEDEYKKATAAIEALKKAGAPPELVDEVQKQADANRDMARQKFFQAQADERAAKAAKEAADADRERTRLAERRRDQTDTLGDLLARERIEAAMRLGDKEGADAMRRELELQTQLRRIRELDSLSEEERIAAARELTRLSAIQAANAEAVAAGADVQRLGIVGLSGSLDASGTLRAQVFGGQSQHFAMVRRQTDVLQQIERNTRNPATAMYN